ncbi:MAG TPA: FecR domain-containing protein, partial [Pyrinomonadaceae bacterium]|nr:FecR domain-containing protein [Pyrinomonadaceae bacterium]
RTKFEEIKLGIRLAEQLPQLTAPDSLWQEVESALGRDDVADGRVVAVRPLSWRLPLAVAAGLILAVTVGVWLFNNRTWSNGPGRSAWLVTTLGGTPKIGSENISHRGSLSVGEWLETDGSSSAQIAVGTIGNVDIGENTRVRLLETQPTEHRLELARGKMSARIWAPPRLFFVDTPSAVAADLGCAYTLSVDDKGDGRLSVTSGWVALQANERESIVPAGASCETQIGTGPGTPFFDDSTPEFQKALKKLDFDKDPATRSEALVATLNNARTRDTLTLWHLLPRVNEGDRALVYEKMQSFAAPPAGVTREGVLKLDQTMLDLWRVSLLASWELGDGGKGNPKNLKDMKSLKVWPDFKTKDPVKK